MDLGIRGRVALCARNEKVLAETADVIRKRFGVRVLERVLDVTDAEAVKNFVAATVERFGAVHIGVANGGGPPCKTFAETTIGDWQSASAMNFMSAVYLAREMLPHMQRQKWGRFVTVTSITVKQPTEGLILSNLVRATVVAFLCSEKASYVSGSSLTIDGGAVKGIY